jgi:hypothetical protein
MSKMDDLRAMREARYERAAARAAKPDAKRGATPTRAPATEPTRAPTRAARPATEPAAEPAEAASPEPRLCGHRAISGRTCTREHGHAAKSHRYS